MSTDMAISLAKKFIRQISQPFDHTQTGISLWKLEDIKERQRKDREEAARALEAMPNGGGVNGLEGGFDYADGVDDIEGMTGPDSITQHRGVPDNEMDMEYGEIDDAALMDIPMEDL